MNRALGCRFLAFVATVCIAVSPGYAADGAKQKEEQTNCSLKRLTSVEVTGEPATLVPAKLGELSGWMVLNTSSMVSSIFESTIKHNGLPTQKFQGGLNSGLRPVTQMLSVKGLQIGTVAYKPTYLIVLPGTQTYEEFHGLPILGSLGIDLLSNVDFELDLGHRKFNLYSPDHCPGKVVYWTDNYASAPIARGKYGEFYFPVELDGKKIEATFDVQLPASRIDTFVTRGLYDFDEKSAGTEKVEDSKGSSTYYYRAMKMTAPGLAITNERVQLTEGSRSCTYARQWGKFNAAGYRDCLGAHPLTLGNPVLVKLRIYFAMKEGMIYYSNADATR